MKMFLVVLFLFISSLAKCCCALFSVDTYPRNSSIPLNPIFIITFSESDFKFKGDSSLDKLQFYVDGESAPRIELNIQDIWFSGSNGQVVLKPTHPLTANEKVHLSVELKPEKGMDSTKFALFSGGVQNKHWLVKNVVDTIPPKILAGKITTTLVDDRASSVGGFAFKFKAALEDNMLNTFSEKKYGTNYTAMYYKFTINTETFIVPTFNLAAGIYSSICGNNSSVRLDTEYIAQLTAIDLSGNESGPVEVPFKITLPKPVVIRLK